MLLLRGAAWIAALALLLPSVTHAVLDSNFNGWAVSSVADAAGTYTVGEGYAVRLVIGDEPAGTGDGPWYPWDPAKEYTVVISTTVADFYDPLPVWPGTFWTVEFGTTIVEIYEDDGTAADFQTPSTFADGTLILSGTTSDYSGPFNTVGALNWGFTGSVEFTGGAGLELLECVPGSALQFNHSVDVVGSMEPTYDERYVGKFDCEGIATSVDQATWGRVKANYR